ncbi:cysteine hydrolase family protein [Mucilaginibacter agri]|uniref:Isochorismatase family protein n=1 Tax=Mucilaginibacter agri TaxID=2695265 RepID=A0A965ZHP9_9SPHI|nr:isochorismatase family cysteine hydrolase [Mucilaginibacter agri]NCD71235.1 isochorismatase family protein [Mucilaginibacter agri]
MKALIIIDAQNEFSKDGKRPVPDHLKTIEVIKQRVEEFRKNGKPIAWVRHFNKPSESPAFVPGTWGAEFVRGLGPKEEVNNEKEFRKDVYGAFTGSDIGEWLNSLNVSEVIIIGFYTHGCVSTTAREAIMGGLSVYIEIEGTATCDIEHEILGIQPAVEVRRSALLQLANMGIVIL